MPNKISTPRTTRVRISLLVDVDVNGWALDYGVEAKPNVVRREVKDYLRNVVNDGPAGFEFMTLVDEDN